VRRGQQGFVRNLTTGEILNQILFFPAPFPRGMPPPCEGKNRTWLTNVVFMGMGEPLANYDNVYRAIAVLNSPKRDGLGFSSGYTFDFRSCSANPVDCRRKICNYNLLFLSTRLTMNCVTVSFPLIANTR